MSIYSKLKDYAQYTIDLGVEGVPALRARVLSIDQLMARGAMSPAVMVALTSGAAASESVPATEYERRVDAAFKAALIDFHEGPEDTCPENGVTLGMLAAFRLKVYTEILSRAGLAPEVKQAASFRPDERNGSSSGADRTQTWNVDRPSSDAVGGRVGD